MGVLMSNGMRYCTDHRSFYTDEGIAPDNGMCPYCKTAGKYSIVDHSKDVPAEERTGSGEYSMSMLCRQDKEQLDRIEKMLKKILIRVK